VEKIIAFLISDYHHNPFVMSKKWKLIDDYVCFRLSLLSVKIKSKSRVNAQADMRVTVSNIVQCFEELISKKQEQKSH